MSSDPHPREPVTVLGRTVDIERLTYAAVVVTGLVVIVLQLILKPH